MKNQQEQEEIVGSLMSPSFSSYTSSNLVDITNQVNQDYFRSLEPPDNGFEFVTFHKPAYDIFLDGYVGHVFPVFNQDMSTLYESDDRDGCGQERDSRADKDDVMALQLPMRNLMIYDDSDPLSSSSSSSSGGDDLGGIPLGSYCVWTPNSPKASPRRPKKSNSTRLSSKQWNLLDLLRRNNNDGKDSSVFLTLTSSRPNLEESSSFTLIPKSPSKFCANTNNNFDSLPLDHLMLDNTKVTDVFSIKRFV